MTTKTINISLLEKKFKKLHTMVDFAKESCQAILFHTKRLAELNPTEDQKTAYQEMVYSINIWIDKLNILNSTMMATEAMYYKQKSLNDCCEVIETIPACAKGYMPNTFQMTETFYRVGYYVIEGDPLKLGNKEYTVEDIMKNIQELQTNIVLCLKALINATYQGVWDSTGLIINKLFDFEPNAYIYKLLKSYNVNMEE